MDGEGDDRVDSVWVDKVGNIILCGFTTSRAMNFFHSSDRSGALIEQSNAVNAAILAKYTSWGTVVWTTKVNGTRPNEFQSCTTDSDGNVYAAGYFGSQSIVYNSDGTANLTLPVTGTTTTGSLLVKYNGETGNVQWAITMDLNTQNDQLVAVRCDENDNVYVVGHYASSPFNITDITGITQSTLFVASDAYLVKYTKQGVFQWVSSVGGASNTEIARNLAIDADGNAIFVLTSTGTTVQFRNATGFVEQSNWGSSSDCFISKFNPSGKFLWAARIGNPTSDVIYGVTTSINGSIFVSGEAQASLTADYLDFYHASGIKAHSTRPAYSASYLARYDKEGNFQWATRGFRYQVGWSVAADSKGNCYFVGSFLNTGFPTFYDRWENAVYLPRRNGSSGSFILFYNSTGDLLWNSRVDGPSGDAAYTVAVDPRNDQAVIAGTFSDAATSPVFFFDSRGSHIGTRTGWRGSYLYKLTNAGLLSNEVQPVLSQTATTSTTPSVASTTITTTTPTAASTTITTTMPTVVSTTITTTTPTAASTTITTTTPTAASTTITTTTTTVSSIIVIVTMNSSSSMPPVITIINSVSSTITASSLAVTSVSTSTSSGQITSPTTSISSSSLIVSLASVSTNSSMLATPSSTGETSTTEIYKVNSETKSFDRQSTATQIDQSTIVVLAVVSIVGSIICCLAVSCFFRRKNHKECRNSDTKRHHNLDYKTDANTDVTQEVA